GGAEAGEAEEGGGGGAAAAAPAVEPRLPRPRPPPGLRERPGRRLGVAVPPDLAGEHPALRPELEPVPGPHLPGEAVVVAPGDRVVEELHPAVAEHQVEPQAAGILGQAHPG